MPARVKKDTKERLLFTESFPLPRAGYADVLVPKMMAATRIWNACVWESREAKKAEGRWPSEAELKAKFKTFVVWKELAAQSAQAVVEEYFEAVRAYRRHRANGHAEQRPPGFKPKQSLRTITWKKQSISLQDGMLTLKFRRGLEPLCLPVPPLRRELGEIVEVKIKAHLRGKGLKGFTVHITHDLGVPEYREAGETGAIDINHAIWALSLSNGTQYLFNLRELAAKHQYRAKTLAWFQGRVDRCQPGSRRREKYQAAKYRFLERMDAQIQQMEHALTKIIAEICESHDVAEVVVGDLKNLRRSARKGAKNRKANQKINNQMPYARMIAKLDYKHKLCGVRQREQSERDTSSYCAACGTYTPSSRKRRGLWVCSECHAVAHADLNSSQNQLKLRLIGKLDVPNELEFNPPIVYRWDKEAKQFVKVSAGN